MVLLGEEPIMAKMCCSLKFISTHWIPKGLQICSGEYVSLGSPENMMFDKYELSCL